MKTSTLLHGGDYNPDQWLKHPDIIAEDFRLMKLAHVNVITLGVFAWAALEPEEGRYTFEWMDDIFERAAQHDIKVILATPSGGKPNWLALKYPEVRRCQQDGTREPQQGRHNHCLTSPVYREKVRAINTQLVERYGKHPALVLWHISNEFGGYCYCDLCKAAFQEWLKARYQTLDALNDAYWSRFWSHTYMAWDQIQTIDPGVHGLELDWKRFMTHQCASFIRNEAEPLRRLSPDVPVTTNFMEFHESYNYWELAKELDVVSWDSYPRWHVNPALDETAEAAKVALMHDICRSMKDGKPWLLMETTPSNVNWQPVSPLRRPGFHRLNCLQAVAHGSDAVCYFQIRKGRGSSEKFHGAVIDHVGHENTRVFREVAELGAGLEKMSDVTGARTPAEVALIFDWENRWAIQQSQSPQNTHKEYIQTCVAHYRPFWERGIAVDAIDAETNLDNYRLVIAPMLHMVRGDQAARLTEFVRRGGTLVATYLTGQVNETDLCFLGGFPGPLREVLGVWVEEFDALPDTHRRKITANETTHGLSGSYEARHYFDLLHTEGAEVLATYAEDFYAGRPALTVNRFGEGRAYYIASRNDERFQNDFSSFLAKDLKLQRALDAELPPGVTAHVRVKDDARFVFLLNFKAQPALVELGAGDYRDAETRQPVGNSVELPPFGSRVLV